MKSSLASLIVRSRPVSALLLGAIFTAPTFGSNIVYTDFSSVAGLQLNGAAVQAGNVLRLTPALGGQSGSAFSQSAVSLGANVSFSSFFAFRITGSGGAGGGADGLTFAVQTVSNTAGGSGGGLGYAGISNSVAIEFDTYNNGGGDANNNNHIGVDLNGNVNSVALQPITSSSLKDGNIKYAWVDYDGTADLLQVRFSDLAAVRPGAALISYNVDLSAVLGNTNAYVGFTSGTGAGVGNHDILTWEFRDTFAPVGVPDSAATASLFAPALLGLLVLARRRSLR
jgi:hypothetical protein